MTRYCVNQGEVESLSEMIEVAFGPLKARTNFLTRMCKCYFACDIRESAKEIWVLEEDVKVIMRKIEVMSDLTKTGEITRTNVLLTPERMYIVDDPDDVNNIWAWYRHRFETAWKDAEEMAIETWQTSGAVLRAKVFVWKECPWYIPIGYLDIQEENARSKD